MNEYIEDAEMLESPEDYRSPDYNGGSAANGGSSSAIDASGVKKFKSEFMAFSERKMQTFQTPLVPLRLLPIAESPTPDEANSAQSLKHERIARQNSEAMTHPEHDYWQHRQKPQPESEVTDVFNPFSINRDEDETTPNPRSVHLRNKSTPY